MKNKNKLERKKNPRKKAKAKPSLQVEKFDTVDITNYGNDDYYDDDDFM